MKGLSAYYGSGLSESVLKEIDMEGIGRLLAMTPNNETNSLAMMHFKHMFDSSELYQLVQDKDVEKASGKTISVQLHGRFLFGPECDYWSLSRKFARGASVKKTKLTTEFGFDDFTQRHPSAIPLFLISETGELSVFTKGVKPHVVPGSTLISIVDNSPDKKGKPPVHTGLDY